MSDGPATEVPEVPPPTEGDALAAVPAQADAVASLRAALDRPVHAYLLVGPAGSGVGEAARAFAAELLAGASTGADADRHRRLALAGAHPDLELVEREGAAISREQARGVVARAARSPVESPVKVLLLTEFHLVTDAAPILLKTLEEPPPTTVFLIVAEDIPPELATIASRCVVIRFAPLPDAEVERRLLHEGIEPSAAADAAAAAGGDLDRARLLSADPGLAARVATWSSVPDRLDGTGAAAAQLVDEIVSQLDEALAPIDERHHAEAAALADEQERMGLGATAKRALEARQRRERRRFRQDDLRFGLSVLARALRDRLVEEVATETWETDRRTPGPRSRAGDPFAAFDVVGRTAESLERNPNERLALLGLFCRLRPLGDDPTVAARRGAPSRRGSRAG